MIYAVMASPDVLKQAGRKCADTPVSDFVYIVGWSETENFHKSIIPFLLPLLIILIVFQLFLGTNEFSGPNV